MSVFLCRELVLKFNLNHEENQVCQVSDLLGNSYVRDTCVLGCCG